MQRRNIFMEYVIVAFRSRSDTIDFSSILKQNGVFCEIVNTPKEAGVGCGLSVKISKGNFYIVKRLVFNANKKSFAGFFAVKQIAGKKIVKSI